MPFTTPKKRNFMAISSKLPQSTSHGRKRKRQRLSDAFDGSHISERYTDDKGRKIAKKLKLNEANTDVVDRCHSRSSGDLSTCALALVETSTQTKPSSYRSPAKRCRPRSSTNVSDEDDTQDKKVKAKLEMTRTPKTHPSQSSKEPRRGILRNAPKPESSLTSTTTTYKQRPLPDIYGDDLDKHAAQDKIILDSLKSEGIPVDAIDPIPFSLLYSITLDVVALAEEKDPDVPLKSTASAILGALKDEKFREVVHRCYCIKSFKDIRNHPILRMSRLRFLEPVVGKLY